MYINIRYKHIAFQINICDQVILESACKNVISGWKELEPTSFLEFVCNFHWGNACLLRVVWKRTSTYRPTSPLSASLSSHTSTSVRHYLAKHLNRRNFPVCQSFSLNFSCSLRGFQFHAVGVQLKMTINLETLSFHQMSCSHIASLKFWDNPQTRRANKSNSTLTRPVNASIDFPTVQMVITISCKFRSFE